MCDHNARFLCNEIDDEILTVPCIIFYESFKLATFRHAGMNYPKRRNIDILNGQVGPIVNTRYTMRDVVELGLQV